MVAFDRDQLEDDIYVGLLAQMDRVQVREIADDVVTELTRQLTKLAKPVPPAARRSVAPRTHYVMDFDIRRIVERRLRQQDRMQHVQYALSTLGRTDVKGREGFVSARQVLNWIGKDENYPRLRVELPEESPPVPAYRWWSPSEPPAPKRVVKRGDRETQAFDAGRFTASIKLALAGRPERERTSKQVARWILWGFEGQSVVLTEQLAAAVLECLRRVDDIAYLRWASIAKRMRSVSDFRDEALGLIEHPSPRLAFEPEALQRIRPEVRAQ